MVKVVTARESDPVTSLSLSFAYLRVAYKLAHEVNTTMDRKIHGFLVKLIDLNISILSTA